MKEHEHERREEDYEEVSRAAHACPTDLTERKGKAP
jgi:ferredoxin